MRKVNKALKSCSGFTLIELMIVIIVLAVLLALAVPSYQDSILKGNRSEGKAALLEGQSRMERYFASNKTYTADLKDIGFALSSGIESENGNYKLEVTTPTEACPIVSCYELAAKAQSNQSKDGDLTLNSIGQKLPADKW